MSDWSNFWYQDVFNTHKDEDSGGGGGGSMSTGGLSLEDKEFKNLIYEKLKPLLDKGYEEYTGDRYADRSQGELDLLATLKEGGGYKPLYDKASKNLGFTEGVYKKGAKYGTSELDADAATLMAQGSTYRRDVADQTLADMNRAASMSGMNLSANALGSGAFGGDRAMLAQGLNQQNYLQAAGRELGQMNMQAYNQAINNARGLNQDRMNAAGGYANTVLQNLGVGSGGLDKKYSTSLGAYKEDRGYLDKDNKLDYKMWSDKQNFPWKKMQAVTGMYGSLPFEEKVQESQPASGGK